MANVADYNVANASGASVRADLNNILQAVVTLNSGTSEPSTMYPFMIWIDTNTNLVKMRNGANDAWLTMPFAMNASNTAPSGLTVSGGDLTVDTSTLKVDSTNNRVGIGTATPTKLLSLSESADGTKLRITRGGICEWDFSIGNTSTLTGVGSGALELLPQNAGTPNEFAIGQAGTSTPLFHLTTDQNYFAKKVGIGTAIPGSFNAGANNLVIGTGSGAEGMTIYGGAESNIFFADGTAGSAAYIGRIEYAHSSDLMRFYVNNTNAMTIDSSGNVEVKGGQELKVYRTDNASYGSMKYLTGSGGLQFNDQNSDGISFVRGGSTESMRLDSSGNLFVGCTASPSASVAGIAIFDNGTSDTGIKSAIAGTGFEYHNRFYDGTGQVGYIATQSSATIFNTTSDYRLKDVKGSIQNGLERTLALNPVEFEWKSNGTTAEGFIAHEAQEIFADAVTGEKDGEDMQGMDYGRITPLLVKAIQELSAEVEQLKQQAHDKCEN